MTAPISESARYWQKVLNGHGNATVLAGNMAANGGNPVGELLSVGISVPERERTTLWDGLRSVQSSDECACIAAWALVNRAMSRETLVCFGEVVQQGGSPVMLPTPVAVPIQGSVRAWLMDLHAEREARITHAASLSEIAAWIDRPGVPLVDSVVALGTLARPDAVPSVTALYVAVSSDFSEIHASYNGSRFSSDAVIRLLLLMQAALTAMAASPDAEVTALSLTSDVDLVAFAQLNATDVSYDDACLHTLIEAQVATTPDAIAIVGAGVSVTYAELNRRANQLAHTLRARGVGTDSLVGICVERSVGMLVGLLAILKAGAAYVPLDPEYPRERLAFMLADTKRPLVLVQRSTVAALPDGLDMLDVDDTALLLGASHDNPMISQASSSLAYVIYTSGSTGQPKGALNEHRQIVNCLQWMQSEFVLNARDRVLQKTPYSFDASICELFWPLLAGAVVVLAKPQGHKDPEYLVETIIREQITLVDFVPSMLRVFLSHPRARECTSLRHVTCGGEALTVELKDAFFAVLDAALHNLYGPTEAAVNVAYWRVERDATHVAIGTPVANTQAYILDAALRPVPIGVAGELFFGGAQICRGYLNRPDLTSERFIKDPFATTHDARLYRTGDLARLRADGTLEFLGRVDYQVKLRGFRVELGEIEMVLEQHADVSQAAVVLREERANDARLVAYLKGNPSAATNDSLRQWLERALPDHMVPAWYVWLDSMPMTPSGKLDRAALPVPRFGRPDTGQAFVAPRGSRENTLCGIFADALGFDPVGAEDSFFLVGGNSLLAMSVLGKIRGRLGIAVPVERFFESPTPRELAALIATERDPAMPRIRAQRHRERSAAHEPIALVGMAGKFPGASDVDALWRLICAGDSHLTRFSDAELDPSVPADMVADPNYVKARGMIGGYDQFDAAFFDVTPREARLLDPQHRLLLETTWAALEHSGNVPGSIRGLVGVYAGVYGTSYLLNNLLTHPEFQGQLDDTSILLQNDKDYVATRIAHKLDLHGPAVSVHTACSTSLVAVAEAFWSLRTGRCDVAIAGAASITCPVRSGYMYQEGGMFSADGLTRPFDAAATGTTFNDGVAVVVLKRLSDAEADGDTIYGVITGAAVNNDGAKKSSFTAPSIEGQAAVIRMALDVAGVPASSIGYVEAHGTATPIGDPIEVRALTEAFRDSTDATGFCALGSVKSNIGHLVSAAGATGLIKAALALHEKVIPGTANYVTPNAAIGLETTPFFVTSEQLPWHATAAHPRRAGVSSFGVGGTNAHVIVEEAPPLTPETESPRSAELLLLSARTITALDAASTKLTEALTLPHAHALADVSFTLAMGRKHFRERRFVVAANAENAAALLAAPASCHTHTFSGNAPNVVFLFPGQGAQSPNMGLTLYQSESVFRAAVDECAEILRDHMQVDIRAMIYPPDNTQAAVDALSNTSITQPALFIVEYATATLLTSWGVVPSAMIGHSIGEFVAAVISGVMSLPDALYIVAARGRLMESMSRGAMLSVRMSADALLRELPASLDIASDNGPLLSVVAGPVEEIATFQAVLEGRGVVCRELQTSHAFHSRMMDPAVPLFLEIVRGVTLSEPRIPFVSTLTGTWITRAEAMSAEYWANHLRQPVLFRAAVGELFKQADLALLEIGPRNTLTTLARQQAHDPRALLATATLGSTVGSEWPTILAALGQLWCAGVSIDFASVFRDEHRRRVPLPTYAFDRTRYWIDPLPRIAANRTHNSDVPHLLTNSVALSGEPSAQAQAAVSLASLPTVTRSRRERICSTLRTVFEEISGFELDDVSEQVTFLELGLDSLSLTQVAQQLQKTFGMKVTFRELMEDVPDLERLSAFFDQRLPAEVMREELIAPAQILAPSEPAVAANMRAVSGSHIGTSTPTGAHVSRDLIQQTIDKQLAIMQQQLALLMQATNSVSPAAPATTRTPVTSAATSESTDFKLSIGSTQQINGQSAPPALIGTPASNVNAAAAPLNMNVLPEEAQLEQVLKKGFGAIARINKSKADDLTTEQRARLSAFIRRYTKRTHRSKEFTQQHRRVLSDPRAVTGFRPQLKEMVYQVVIDRSSGSHMWDLDGNEYVDTLSGFGCSLFGWQPQFATDAAIAQIARGHEIGPMSPLAAEVAELVCEMTGNERAAFCNTGSEAVMGCMRIARTVTGRDTIAIFNGSYHGIFDEVIVRGTKKLRSVPAAPGILPSTAQNVLILEYGDPAALDILRERGHELAAIMVEPVQSRRPELQPKQYLHDLRKIADDCGAVYIFDEVITGFRCHPGGAQAYFDVRADLVSYGKVIGGGYPFAVIAGKSKYMDALDGGFWEYGDASVPTVGVTYFAGTFCRHPLALAVAKAALIHMKEQGPALQAGLNARTAELAAELNAFFVSVRAPLEVRYFASLWKVFWTEEQPYGDLLFYYMRDKGIHILDMFPCFLTTAHSAADVAAIVAAFKESVMELQTSGFLPGGDIALVPVAQAVAAGKPPVEGARLGRDQQGNPAWFVRDPNDSAKFVRVVHA